MTGKKKSVWPEKKLTDVDSLLKTMEDIRAEAAKMPYGRMVIELELEVHDSQIAMVEWELKRRRMRHR